MSPRQATAISLTKRLLLLIVFGAASVFLIKAIYALGPREPVQSREPEIRVVLKQLQLPTNDGNIPVEIVQPIVSSSKPNNLENLTYILRNNSDRAIVALAVSKNITYEAGGNIYITSLCATLDYAFHPDLRSPTLFEPGSQTTMEASGPLSLDDDVVIKQISLRVDYVLFADNTKVGAGGEGEKKVNLMREGARKYKDWLGQNYSRNGKSLALVLPLMQERQPPAELKLDLDQVLGADRYRLSLLKTLETKGAADVEKLLAAEGTNLKIKS